MKSRMAVHLEYGGTGSFSSQSFCTSADQPERSAIVIIISSIKALTRYELGAIDNRSCIGSSRSIMYYDSYHSWYYMYVLCMFVLTCIAYRTWAELDEPVHIQYSMTVHVRLCRHVIPTARHWSRITTSLGRRTT